MKNHLTIFFILSAFTLFSQSKKKVLFIGNSYTYSNNLPQMIADIALSKSDSVIYDSSAPGGYTFQMHCTNSTTWQKIRSQKWDVVVLQAQSQEPSFSPSQVASQTYPYAKQLCDSIRSNNPCTEIMFFMTWGRKNGDLSNCATYSNVCTYDGMQARLRESYMMFSDSFMTSVAPVGVAWKSFRVNYPLVDLYIPDESHPSVHGTYLAACVFYSSMFKKTIVGSTYNPSLPITDVSNIQTIASQTVLDSTEVWNLGSNYPKANFNYTIQPPFTIQFTNTSTNATNYTWSFGSTNANPSYTFPGPGTYTIHLKSNNDCKSDSITKTISFTSVNEYNESEISDVVIANNGVTVNLLNADVYNLEILSYDGKILVSENNCSSGKTYTFNQLPQGIYLLKLQSKKAVLVKKLLLTNN